MVATGQPELVLVSRPVRHRQVRAGVRAAPADHRSGKGFFLSAKFERGKRDIPYLALIRAFRELALDILTESAEQIAAWRRRLIDALGPNGRLIVDLVPEIELIIGPQPEPPELPLGDAENRLRLVVRQFACAFARPEHPLALFLDDLQWVDAASSNLVGRSGDRPETPGTCCSSAPTATDEVPAAQPAGGALDQLRARRRRRAGDRRSGRWPRARWTGSSPTPSIARRRRPRPWRDWCARRPAAIRSSPSTS